MYFKPPQNNHNDFYHPLNQDLNEQKSTKARVMFKGSPSDARRDMRVAKETGLYDRMTEKPSGRGRVYEITFKSEGQFRRFMSQFEVDLMEYPLKESRDDFDYLDVQAAMQDAKIEAPKVVKTRQGFQVMVFSRKLRKHIPQGPPHRTKAAAEKDAKMFEDVQLDEEVTRLKEPHRVQKKKQTRKAKPIKDDVQIDEVTGETTVMAKSDRNQYERITRALTAANRTGKIKGYEGAHFNERTGMLTLIFDSKAHKPASERRKVAKMIKDFGLEFSHSVEEGFASDAQRRAAFASGYKAKGKKKKNEEEEVDEADINLPNKPKNAIRKPKIDSKPTMKEGLRLNLDQIKALDPGGKRKK